MVGRVAHLGPVEVVREAADRVDRLVVRADRGEVVREVVDRVDLVVAHQAEVAAVVGMQVRLRGGLPGEIEVLVVRVDQAVPGEGRVDPRVGER